MLFTITTTTNDGATTSSEVVSSELADSVWQLTRYVTEGVFISLVVTRTEGGDN